MSVCSGICLRSSKDYGHATYTDGLAHSPLKDQLNCELSNAGWLKTVDEKTFKKNIKEQKKCTKSTDSVAAVHSFNWFNIRFHFSSL